MGESLNQFGESEDEGGESGKGLRAKLEEVLQHKRRSGMEGARSGGLRGEVVWRRVPPWHFPKKPGQSRPNSSAFCDDKEAEPMSVVLADRVVAEGRSAADVLSGHAGFGLVALDVGVLIDLGLSVVPDPLEEEPGHALVVGPKPPSVRRAMAKAATWVVPPP